MFNRSKRSTMGASIVGRSPSRSHRSRILRAIRATTAIAAVMAASAITSTATASADQPMTFTVNWTKIGIFPRSAPSMDSAKVGSAVSDGAQVSAVCETEGQLVSSDVATNEVWDRLTDGTYLPNVFLATGHQSWTPGLRRCSELDGAAAATPGPVYQQIEELKYIPQLAQEWALAHVNDTEKYKESDCTWFVSQALWAGNLPKDSTWDSDGHWTANAQLWTAPGQGPTAAAANADAFFRYMKGKPELAQVSDITWSDNSADGAALGDVIAYDWNDGADGSIDHLAIVTGFTPDGNPVVSQHTPAQANRYWSYSEGAHKWIEFAYAGGHGAPRAYLIHITY